MSYSAAILKGVSVTQKSIFEEDVISDDEQAQSLQIIKQESLITAVQEVLPDLGVGFVTECLLYFDQSSEKVINAILEDDLPDFLKSISRYLGKDDIQEFPTIKRDEELLQINLMSVIKNARKDNKKTLTKPKQNNSKQEDLEKDSDFIQKVKVLSQQYNDNKCLSLFVDENKFRPTPCPQVDVSNEHLYLLEETKLLNESRTSRFKSNSKAKLNQKEPHTDNDDSKLFNPERRCNIPYYKQKAHLEKCHNRTFGTKTKAVSLHEIPNETKKQRKKLNEQAY